MLKNLPKTWQKTPISYYGGKQSIMPELLKNIPEHDIYIEPFFGGGSLFWAKEPSKSEIINDYNDNVFNFYHVLKNNFDELNQKIKSTIFGRNTYKVAIVIYTNPTIFNKVERAWAFWFATNAGFNNAIGDIRADRKTAVRVRNKIKAFSREYCKRLETVTLESEDAINLIVNRDHEKAFIYADPPYIGAKQGHYAGYNQQHFNELLKTLSKIKGKFLLSSYPNEELSTYATKNNWSQREITAHLRASSTRNKMKVEILTANYPISM